MRRTPVARRENDVPPGLVDLARQQSLPEYLRAMWARRQFAWAVPLGEIQAQRMNTVLGNLWHVLNPLFLVSVYFVLFGLILETDRGVENFIAFLAVGVFTFYYSSRAITTGATSITRNLGLIRSIPFPRAILPVSAVIGATITFAPALGLMLLVALVTGERPLLTWLLLPVVYAVQAAFTVGVVFLVARITSVVQDFSLMLPFALRLVFYLSGVLYSVERFISDPFLLNLFVFNPFYVFVTLARGAILDSVDLTATLWLSGGGWALVAMVIGFTVFRAGEAGYGRG